MGLNIEPQDDGSFLVDDETDGGIGYRVRVTCSGGRYGDFTIEDLMQDQKIAIASWIAEGLALAIFDLMELNGIDRSVWNANEL